MATEQDRKSYDEVSYQDVLAIPVMDERVMGPEHVDDNGHVGFRAYLDVGMESARPLITGLLGITLEYKKQGHSLFVMHQRIDYLGEVLAGDRITVHTVVTGRTNRTFSTCTHLVNRRVEALALRLETRYVHVSLVTRRPVPFPARLARTIDDLITADGRARR